MAIKVHGNPQSPPSLRVLLALEEKQLDYDFVFIDFMTGQHKKEPFISLNPFGQVPGFEDGDLKLFESRAITKYICEAYAKKGTPLLPEDPKDRALVSVWLEVESLKFDAVGGMLGFEIGIKPTLGLTTDESQVEQLQGQLASVLEVYEGRLSQSKYLGGDSFTLADLHHVPIINFLIATKVKALFDAHPHVSAWCKDLLARSAWAKVLAKMKF